MRSNVAWVQQRSNCLKSWKHKVFHSATARYYPEPPGTVRHRRTRAGWKKLSCIISFRRGIIKQEFLICFREQTNHGNFETTVEYYIGLTDASSQETSVNVGDCSAYDSQTQPWVNLCTERYGGHAYHVTDRTDSSLDARAVQGFSRQGYPPSGGGG